MNAPSFSRQDLARHAHHNANDLKGSLRAKLDALLVVGGNRLTPFQSRKRPAGQPSLSSMLCLGEKLEPIPETGALNVDLALLEHISPIGWENVLLTGEYVLNWSLVKS